MTVKTLSILMCMMCFMPSLKAQIEIKGYVKDSLGNPLPFANVFSQEKDSTLILAFATTDDNGYFLLETSRPKTLVIKATILGYNAQELVFEENAVLPQLIEFKLLTHDLILKEAVVIGNGRVIEKSDTVTFKADAYRDSTERNLEELLKKIPGIDVDKNGTITVKGQPIKKILIEGDDLTGHYYQLMSQNLAADVVDKIQIIDKFNNNKLLRGLRRSDDKVINITLKDNRKSLLFGQVNLGLGNDERTNNSMNLFTFIKKFKMITFGSFNTIGQQSTADRMLSVVLNEGSEFQKLKALVSDQNNTLINIDRTPSVQIGSQNIRFNKSALLSTHFVTRFHETTKITGSITLANDNNFVYTDNDYQYLLKDSIFKLKETNEFNRKPLVFESHLNIEADLGEKTLIQNSSTFRKSSLTNQANTIANLNKIQNTLNDNGIYFNNSFDLTHRINENKAMLTNIQFIYDNKNQVFDINQNDARELPFSKVLTDKIEQFYNKPLTFVSFNSQLFTVRNKNQMSIGLGGVNRSEKFSTALNAYQNNTAIILSDTFSNSYKFNQQNLYGYLNMKTEIKGFQLFGELSSGFYQTKQIYTPSVYTLKKGFYALPTVGFRKEFGKKSLFGTYTFNFNLPQVADLATGLIVTDYRSMQRGSSVTIPSNNQTIIANYVFGSYSDNFMLHTNLIATQSAKGYRSALLFEKDFNISEKIENTFTNQNTSLSTGIDYYSPSIYMRFKIRPNVSYSSYQNSLNGSDLRETKVFSKSITLSVRSAYLKGFNYHLGSTLSQNEINTYLGENKSSNNNLSIGSFLDVYLRFSPRLNMKLESEYFYTSPAKSPPQYYSFFNTVVYYDVVKTKLSLIFTVRNILNTRNFVNTNVNDYSVYTNQVKLLPRFFLIEANFKF